MRFGEGYVRQTPILPAAPPRFEGLERHNLQVIVSRLILALVPVLALAASVDHAAKAAKLIEQARKAELAGDKIQAYLLVQRAAAEAPTDPAIWNKLRALKGAVAVTSLPPGETPPPPEIRLRDLAGAISKRDLQDAARLEGPPVLLPPKPGKRSFHLRGDIKKLYEEVAAAYGLVTIFDRELGNQPSTNLRFDVDDADHRTTLHALSRATNTFPTPLSSKVLLVAQDSTQKRQEYEQTVARVFEIPQRTSVQEAQELMQAIQQTLEIRRITVDSQKRQILMRDRRAKVDLAARLLEEMAQYKPQVEIELELLTAGSNVTRNLGISLPNSASLVSFGKLTNTIGFQGAASGILNFLTFGGGTTFMGIGLGNSQLIADYTRGETQSVLKSFLVASDGQAATLHIGDKYPIVTNRYVGPTPQPGEQVVAPFPTFNFEELGLVLKVTPFVHGPDEASLEIEAEFKVLGSGGFNGIPIINTRKYQSKVRLSTSESAVVAGLVSESDARTLTGIAGLASIPILGPLLSKNGKEVIHSEALILLRPKIRSMPPSERATRLYWYGSEMKPLSPL